MRSSTWIKPILLACSVSVQCIGVVASNDQDDQTLLSSNNDIVQNRLRTANGSKNNIVFILTDDQDSVLDSVSYMPKLQEHIIDKGTSFANHFTTTAICCPARVSLWTGMQPHNTNVTDVSPPYGK
jgi:hypothetical protein